MLYFGRSRKCMRRRDDLYPMDFWYIWSPTKWKSITQPQATQQPTVATPETVPQVAEQAAAAKVAPAVGKEGNRRTLDNVRRQELLMNANLEGLLQPVEVDTLPVTKPRSSQSTQQSRALSQQIDPKDRTQAKRGLSQAVQGDSRRSKGLRWAQNLENSCGTDIGKTDARVLADLEADVSSDSGESFTDPISATQRLPNRMLRSTGAKNLNPAAAQVQTQDSSSDNSSSSIASTSDANVRPAWARVSNGSNVGPHGKDSAATQHSRTSTRRNIVDIEQERSNVRSKSTSSKPRGINGHRQTNGARYISATSVPKLGSAGIHESKNKHYVPQFARTGDHIGNGSTLSEKPRSILKHPGSSANTSSHSASYPNAGRAMTLVELQDAQVKFARREAKRNAKLNRGIPTEGSGVVSARAVRKSSLELARRKNAASSSEPTGKRSESRRRKPTFVLQPTSGNDRPESVSSASTGSEFTSRSGSQWGSKDNYSP